MAAVAVSAAVRDMYLNTRPGYQVNPTGVFDGLVSDLVAGDWLIGSRQKVISVGTPAGNLTPLTVLRSNGTTVTVSWPTASTIRFAR